jgi:hypothetical protein
MRKSGNALLPASNYDQELFDEVQSGRAFLVSIHSARNPGHHRKFWALAASVARFDPHFHNAEEAVRWIKRQIPGLHRRYLDRDGGLVIELESISFASMDQTRFANFYDRALYLWAERIGCDPETLLQETVAA